MTNINNYNTNSDGHDFELSIFRDIDLSSIVFRENFERLENKDRLFFYTAHGQLDSASYYDYAFKGSNKDKARFLTDIDGMDTDPDDPDLDTYLKDYILDHGFNAAESDMAEYNVDLTRVNDFEIVSARGYCQGDYAEIIVDMTQLNKLCGNEQNISDYKDYFHHLIYDAPVGGELTVNGRSVFVTELLDSEYDFDRKHFIKNALAYFDNIDGLKEWLESNVPEYIDYN